MGDRRGGNRFWWIKLGDRDYLEDLGLYGTITLKWIFRLIHIIHMTSGQKKWKKLTI